jgi:hypothetical protein
MYYTALPAALFEPDTIRRLIPWFQKYAIRPKGDYFEGGVTHSLGNSLNPVVLAGLYYSLSGDLAYFRSHPELNTGLKAILEKVLTSRRPDDAWMFPSRYISDGRSLGDYHTGSNVVAWYAFRTFGRILADAYGDESTAGRYRDIGGRIQGALEKHNVVDGRFVEGVNRDGSVPVMIHDGEESDTTLMPFYGFVRYDSLAYRNFMRFAVSEYNVAYNPETRGIMWEWYGDKPKVLPVGPRVADATFPGFIIGLANVVDRETMSGVNGRMTEIRRLTDLNGVLWWWPYGKDGKRGQVTRAPELQSGWATGSFVALFMSQFLGLQYDGPSHTLTFRPFSPSSDFTWEDFCLGGSRFDASVRRTAKSIVAEVANRNAFDVIGQVDLMLPDGSALAGLKEGERSISPAGTGGFLGRETVSVQLRLKPGEKSSVQATVRGR